jgi:hypothetical protein
MRFDFILGSFFSVLMLVAGTAANAQDVESEPGASPNSNFMRVNRRVHSFEYAGEHRPLNVDLTGTALMPKADGRASVEKTADGVEIDAQVHNLGPAQSIDAAELTYVVWALGTDGRVQNLGELRVKNGTATLKTSTNLLTFAMVVTAEPYFAVTHPSEYVVLYNRTKNRSEDTVRADLLPLRPDGNTPLEIYEARNAVRIARQAGAERYASDAFHRAVQLLQQAENFVRLKKGSDNAVAVQQKAREATLAAEDARAKAEQRQRAGDAQ